MSADVQAAHDLLREHYGEEVRPIHEVCQAIQTWLGAICDEHLAEITPDEPWRDTQLHKLANAVHDTGLGVSVMASKSNLLYRLIYLRQPLRTEKCPEHQGHWSGYDDPRGKPCACCVGYDITGWLP